jgi:cytidylate kinase
MLHCPIVKRLVVAVDGPSGVGKGTVARAVARALGYRHIDTGAMYRAVAWRALTTGVALDAGDDVAAVAARARFDLGDGAVRIDGHDVTSAIRTPDMDKAAALVARNAAVRDVLVVCQRALGAGGGVVMEGRDIGTVVFPQAELKIYLDASQDERARRRAADPAHASSRTSDIAHVAQDLAARDKSDSTRSVAPLTRAADAVYIDTTGVSVDDVVSRVLALVQERQGLGARG